MSHYKVSSRNLFSINCADGSVYPPMTNGKTPTLTTTPTPILLSFSALLSSSTTNSHIPPHPFPFQLSCPLLQPTLIYPHTLFLFNSPVLFHNQLSYTPTPFSHTLFLFNSPVLFYNQLSYTPIPLSFSTLLSSSATNSHIPPYPFPFQLSCPLPQLTLIYTPIPLSFSPLQTSSSTNSHILPSSSS